MKNRMSSKTLAAYGLFIALSMVLSYVEFLVPFSFAVPGVKLGLANIVTMFALYRLGKTQALVLSLVRVLLVSLLFGNAFALLYSLSGAVLSYLMMLLFIKTGRFGPIGVGIVGGVSHNVGQILCAMLLLETKRIVYYLPVLLISGTLAGLVIGLLAGMLVNRIGNKI